MNSPIRLLPCPTLREPDGLAMSSRNTRLSPAERKNATAIYGALQHIKENLRPGSPQVVLKEAETLLAAFDFKVDYVEIADAANLEIVNDWDGHRKIVALTAAFQHEVRLIDNMLLN
ncbi:MAG TPA: pantoate--beta-alanine ligase, partial [Chitinophagaceae bacterium]|nr:pantoate--beta-alanine ligase [Chitinophagaceae bacterium]